MSRWFTGRACRGQSEDESLLAKEKALSDFSKLWIKTESPVRGKSLYRHVGWNKDGDMTAEIHLWH